MRWNLLKLLMNLQSVVLKFEDFAVGVRMHQVNIAGVCETWRHDKVLIK